MITAWALCALGMTYGKASGRNARPALSFHLQVSFLNASDLMRQLKDRHGERQHPYSLLAARMKLACVVGVLIAALLGLNLAPATAGTEVLGQLDAMQFRAENASTSEVLEALAASFKLTYKLPPNINRNWNGLYSGSLRRVLARILDDTDYIIKNSDDGIEVIVLRASGASDTVTRAASSDTKETSENIVAASAPRAARLPPPPAPKLTSPPPLASYLPNN